MFIEENFYFCASLISRFQSEKKKRLSYSVLRNSLGKKQKFNTTQHAANMPLDW
jgi:hypothetical protein